jgi:beta-galactosidase
MIGYHLTGQTAGEWFPDFYRERGPDLSGANAAGFRAWLTEKYKTDAGLQAAWSSSSITLQRVEIPIPEPGRFPIGNAKEGEKFRAYYDLDHAFNWVDYSRYTSAITARRLLELCALVKEKTARKKLTVLFYGYNLDLPGSMNGHNEIVQLLDSPDVDMLASPMSYQDRLLGASTGFMAAVDTIAARGKLWMIENDMRTHRWTREHQPPEIADDPNFIAELKFISRPSELYETLGILKRDYAAMRVHRSGTWWMDLAAVGSFQDQAIWDLFKDLTPLFEADYRDPQPYRPEVALIIDEQSRNFEESLWDVGYQTLNNTRYQLGTTGTSFGLYLLEDFEEGRIPDCKVYIFPNSVSLSEERIKGIRARLEAQGGTAIWMYAPGWINGKTTDIEQMRRLTGINLVQKDGQLGSYSIADAGRQVWGLEKRDQIDAKSFNITPRFVVDDSQAEVIGRYLSDDQPSMAIKRQGKATHVYTGDINLTTEILRDLFLRAGVHLWSTVPLAVHPDRDFLSVHAKNADVYELIPPRGKTLRPHGAARILGKSERGVFVAFQRAETIFFDVVEIGAAK